MFGHKRLQRENAELRAALIFYAASQTWKGRPPADSDMAVDDKSRSKSLAFFDRGDTARIALSLPVRVGAINRSRRAPKPQE